MNEPQTAEEFRRRRRVKNWVLFAALVAFVVVIYFVAIVRMSGG
ncbi:MAG: hypothetical protein ACFCUQ_18905 [Kiloniellales bacterium]